MQVKQAIERLAECSRGEGSHRQHARQARAVCGALLFRKAGWKKAVVTLQTGGGLTCLKAYKLASDRRKSCL